MPRTNRHDEMEELYAIHGNVWKVAEIMGLCGQSVHEALTKRRVINKMRVLTIMEKSLIAETYKTGIERGDGKLKQLSKMIGRTEQFICRYAGSIGLTNMNRTMVEANKKAISERTKEYLQNNPHPRGSLGMKHSIETLAILSKKSKAYSDSLTDEQISSKVMKMLKTKDALGTMYPQRPHGRWKQQWVEVGGKRFFARSSWEYYYAQILERRKNLKIITEWEHEPQTFWFEKILRGVRSYLPDFRVTNLDDSIEYHEVKGWFDPKSITKIKRMKIYYPDIKLIVIDKKAYKEIIRRGI